VSPFDSMAGSHDVAPFAVAKNAEYVIVGGGYAGATALRQLVEDGFAGKVLLLSAEDCAPYDRTALSKPSLLSGSDPAPPWLWEDLPAWDDRIEVQLKTTVSSLDLEAKTLITSAGRVVPFDKLLLATGAQPRRLHLPGHDASGVLYLRDVRDARAIRDALKEPCQLVVVGGGVIGLEVAASARASGHQVTVLEVGHRVLGRNVPPEIAAALVGVHDQHGVVVRTGVVPVAIVNTGNRVSGIELAGGEVVPADVVVIGVGIAPRDEIAESSGLLVDDGIIVDARGQTSHPDVYAAGDAARMKLSPVDRGIRLESWKSAGRQAEIAAKNMMGIDAAYADQPWSWSDQYDFVMQSVGLASPTADRLVCGGVDQGGVLVLLSEGGEVMAACGVSRGASIAKPIRAIQLLIENSGSVDLEAVRENADDLKAVARLLTSNARAVMSQ
jgi:3-phenylpropionate/trans-cinnamate dioxygenase ferredoxin reductase subunit